jgi:fatty acid desaturase
MGADLTFGNIFFVSQRTPRTAKNAKLLYSLNIFAFFAVLCALCDTFFATGKTAGYFTMIFTLGAKNFLFCLSFTTMSKK